MSLRRAWVVALSVFALAIVGCGGGGGSDPGGSTAAATGDAEGTTSGALTKAELIKQGDAICAKVNATVGTVNPESPGATVRVTKLYSGMLESLKDLGNPKETEGDYGEYLRARGELVTALYGLRLAAEKDDPSALKTAENGAEGTLRDFQGQAGEYGFKECSQGPSAPAASVPSSESGETEAGGEEAEAESPIELVPEEK